MSMPHERLELEALGLPSRDRARLALRLIESLDEESDDPDEVDRLWAAEVERRLEEYRGGRDQGTPADEVFFEARRRIE